MPIQGFTRMRRHGFGKQSAFGTAASVTRAMPWRGVPDINPNWTDNDTADFGSIDPVASPYRTRLDVTVPYSGALDYESASTVGAIGLRGGVTPTGGGAAKTWTFSGLSTSTSTFDYMTDEFTDDVTADGMRLRDVILENWEYSFGEDLGPWQFTGTGRASSVDTHITATSVTLSSNLPLVFGADTELFIDDAAGSIGGTKLSDVVHAMSVRVETNIDLKYYANGSNSRFQLSGYGISGRTVTASITFAKQNSIIGAGNSETVDWLNADPVNRFVQLKATSGVIITGSTPYSLTLNLPLTWRTRSDGEIGGNTTVTLEGVGRYDSVLGYPLRKIVVNSRADVP